MNPEEKKYKAFISYRHVEPDKTIAEKLQKYLEHFSYSNHKTNWRIFRDESELYSSSDLSEDITRALENSEFLIVVCSKKMTESKWCEEEIKTFKGLHDNTTKNILTIIANDTHKEAFVKALCTTLSEKTLEDGSIVKEETEVEPLAANIVSDSMRGMQKKLKTEYLRLAAPMCGVEYDSLINRKRKEEQRRLITLISLIAAAITLISVSFAIYNNNINKILESKNVQISEQLNKTEEANNNYKTANENYREQLEKTLVENARNYNLQARLFIQSGQKRDAIESAIKAFEVGEDNTALLNESKLLLSSQIGAFDSESRIPVIRLTHDKAVKWFVLIMGGTRLVSRDAERYVYLWDTKTGELLWKSDKGIDYDNFFIEIPRRLSRGGNISYRHSAKGIISAVPNFVSGYELLSYEKHNPENDLFYDTDYFLISKDTELSFIDAATGEETVVQNTEKPYTSNDDYSFFVYKDDFCKIPSGIFASDAGSIVLYSKDGKDIVRKINITGDCFDTDDEILCITENYIFVRSPEYINVYKIENDTVGDTEYKKIDNPVRSYESLTCYELGDYILFEAKEALFYYDKAILCLYERESANKMWQYEAELSGGNLFDAGLIEKEQSGCDTDVIYYVYGNKISFIDAESGTEIAAAAFDSLILDYYYADKVEDEGDSDAGVFFVTLENGKTENISLTSVSQNQGTGMLLVSYDKGISDKYDYSGGTEALGYKNSLYVDIIRNVKNTDCEILVSLEKSDASEGSGHETIQDMKLSGDKDTLVITTEDSVKTYNLSTGEFKNIAGDESKLLTSDDINEEKFSIENILTGDLENIKPENKHIVGACIKDNVYLISSDMKAFVFDINGNSIAETDLSFIEDELYNSVTEISDAAICFINDDIMQITAENCVWYFDTLTNELIYYHHGMLREKICYDSKRNRILISESDTVFSYPFYTDTELYNKAKQLIKY